MFNTVQVLLMTVVLVLTALSVLIGIQVFKLIRQLRRLASKFQLFLQRQDSQSKVFSPLVDEETTLAEEEKNSRNLSSFVSVGFHSKAPSVSSRSFYRNGRNLS
jgi:hypothetical protein